MARRVVVSGQVQGVGFRMACAREAARLAVGGWVRNRSDGAVELHAEGRPQDVERLVAWARHGPRHAQVEGVEVTDAESQELRGFDITG